ncbi:MAG: YopX family protein [Nanoarchaeota archaeon]
MRELKCFRAWLRHEKRFEYFSIGDWGKIKYIQEFENEVNQWTGLKDKQGKDIYEGDICNAKTFTGNYKGVISFISGCFVLEIFQSDNIEYDVGQVPDLCDFEEIMIVGNIYENSELLKGD